MMSYGKAMRKRADAMVKFQDVLASASYEAEQEGMTSDEVAAELRRMASAVEQEAAKYGELRKPD